MPLAIVMISGATPAMLVGEELAGPPDAGLDLVEDQQEAMFVAEAPQAAQELGRNDAHAALALDRLDHDGADARPDRRLDGGKIANRDLVEPIDLRPEAFDIFGLAARGDGRERASMEGALEGQDAIALGMAADRLALARHLDRRLVGFGAGIGEEDEIGEGRLRQPLLQGVRHPASGKGWRYARASAPASVSASTR